MLVEAPPPSFGKLPCHCGLLIIAELPHEAKVRRAFLRVSCGGGAENPFSARNLIKMVQVLNPRSSRIPVKNLRASYKAFNNQASQGVS